MQSYLLFVLFDTVLSSISGFTFHASAILPSIPNIVVPMSSYLFRLMSHSATQTLDVCCYFSLRHLCISILYSHVVYHFVYHFIYTQKVCVCLSIHSNRRCLFAIFSYIFSYFHFSCYLAATGTTLGYYRGRSLIEPNLVTAFFYVNCRKELRHEVRSVSPAKDPLEFEPRLL